MPCVWTAYRLHKAQTLHGVTPAPNSLLEYMLAALLKLHMAAQGPIVAALQQSGMQADCPFRAAGADGAAEQLTPESAARVDAAEFAEYAGRLNQYLQARTCLRRSVNAQIPSSALCMCRDARHAALPMSM